MLMSVSRVGQVYQDSKKRLFFPFLFSLFQRGGENKNNGIKKPLEIYFHNFLVAI